MRTHIKVKKQFSAAAALPVLSAVSTGATILSTVSGFLKGGPKAPKETPPTEIPTQDSSLVADAKRKALIAQSQRGGRASTILSDPDTFGGN